MRYFNRENPNEKICSRDESLKLGFDRRWGKGGLAY